MNDKHDRAARPILCILLALSACSQANAERQQHVELRSKARYDTLPQGWTRDIQERFWFTPQGNAVLPYTWFLALERPLSTQRVASDANFERLNFIPQPKSKYNPDALAIGLTKDRTQGEDFLGLTCAACHATRLSLGDAHVIVDGAPALADVDTFLRDLPTAVKATLDDAAKFERFATRVLPQGASAEDRKTLRVNMKGELDKALGRKTAIEQASMRKGHAFDQTKPGYGRVDAFGNILNTTSGPLDTRNAALPGAPVSFPCLWDSPLADSVQWNGGLLNTPVLGALSRNIGEVLGVFGRIDVRAEGKDPRAGYENSVNLESLGKLENWLKDLTSPAWPSEYLPDIDRGLARSGETIYQRECVACHSVLDSRNPARSFKSVLIPADIVGTDPTMVTNLALRRAHTGPAAGRRVMLVQGAVLPAETPAFDTVANAIAGVMLREPRRTLQVGLADRARSEELRKQPHSAPLPASDDAEAAMTLAKLFAQQPLFSSEITSYRARPLNGIWATAPYLHNGSVLNLADLLTTSGQRPCRIFVGSREFDPVKVGLRSDPDADGMEIDCKVPGNSNRGHEYGTDLPEAEKRALLEYLKTL